MGDPTTLTLNLTFLGTVGLGLVMFLIMFLMFVIMLLLAGVGRLVALVVLALVGTFPRDDADPIVRVSEADAPEVPSAVGLRPQPKAAKIRPALSADWAAAVAAADARAAARENASASVSGGNAHADAEEQRKAS